MAAETASPFECFWSSTYWYTQNLEEHHRDPKTRKSQRNRDFGCWECGMLFLNARELAKHVKRHPPGVSRVTNERKEFGCKTCGKHFYTFMGLEQHMQSKRHGIMTSEASPSSDDSIKSIKCKECNQMFKTFRARKAHMNSTKHKPLSYIVCPMHSRCTKHFSSPSALLNHLESDACKSGMDRTKVFHTVQACDTAGVIHEPIHTARPPTPVHTAVSSPSLESYDMCSDISGRLSNAGSERSLVTPEQTFSTLSRQISQLSLSEFVAVAPSVETPTIVRSISSPSPVATPDALSTSISGFAPLPHNARIYCCPRITILRIGSLHAEGSKTRSFKTLGALANHIESGACHGGKAVALKFMRMVEEHLPKAGFGKFKLLLPRFEVRRFVVRGSCRGIE